MVGLSFVCLFFMTSLTFVLLFSQYISFVSEVLDTFIGHGEFLCFCSHGKHVYSS